MITRNGSKFFKLYDSAPHMSGYLIDYMLNPMRKSIYDTTIASYDTVTFPVMMEKLHFSDAKECKEFLDNRNVQYVDDSNGITKSANAPDSALKSKRKEKKIEKKKTKAPDPLSLIISCKASRLASQRR